MKFTVKINNLPQIPERFTYFVCRVVDGSVWFYGAWYAHQKAAAARQAAEIDGFVVIGEKESE